MAFDQELYDAILNGKAPLAEAAVGRQLKAGVDPLSMIADTMIPAMDEVGLRYQEEEFFVPELMLAGRAMKAAMEPLRPLLANAGAKPTGVIVAGAVKGDLHDIGKNLLIAMLEGAGFKVHDVGTDVPPQKFIDAIRTYSPQILCLSALLTTTMPAMRATITAIEKEGLRDVVKILVGGAPINNSFAEDIGADGYGATATDAVALARKFVAPAVATR